MYREAHTNIHLKLPVKSHFHAQIPKLDHNKVLRSFIQSLEHTYTV